MQAAITDEIRKKHTIIIAFGHALSIRKRMLCQMLCKVVDYIVYVLCSGIDATTCGPYNRRERQLLPFVMLCVK